MDKVFMRDDLAAICKAKKMSCELVLAKFKDYYADKYFTDLQWYNRLKKWVVDEKPAKPSSKPIEAKSQVKFWGPGHPDWERLNKTREEK